MMSAKSQQPNAQPGVEPTDAGASAPTGNGSLPGAEVVGVDKIRDLLFGNQMQDYDSRFAKLEERFLQRFKDIESETSRNLSAFESNAKKQVESLANQLREEKDTRADTDKEIDRTLREQNQTLEKRLRSVADQLSQVERDMADRLTQEAHALREEIKRKNEAIQHAMEKMFAELSNVKTDRNLLAGLFVEVAKALNHDMGPKSTGKGGAESLRGWPTS
jgi:DNA repair exonuclease SbcCD ATPase subunit